jgi:hypothetical protein
LNKNPVDIVLNLFRPVVDIKALIEDSAPALQVISKDTNMIESHLCPFDTKPLILLNRIP